MYFHFYNISPEPRSQPSILLREPPGQATVSHGSCRRRVLWRPHTLYPVSPKSSHVHPYPRGPQAYEESLTAPIRCRKSRPKWAVRIGSVLMYNINYFGTYSSTSSSKIYGRGGNARGPFDLITNQQQAKLLVVPGSKRSSAVWGGQDTPGWTKKRSEYRIMA